MRKVLKPRIQLGWSLAIGASFTWMLCLPRLAWAGELAGMVNTANAGGAEIIVRAWQPLIRNEALLLDGRSGSLMTELTDLSGSELTIEFWFKGSSIQSAVRQQSGVLEDFKEEWSGRSFGSSLSETRGWVVAGWNGLHILSNDGLLNGIYYDRAVANGEWHHVALTWKQNTRNGFCSYMDGKLYAQRDSRDTPIGNYREKVYFGAWNGSGEPSNGLLDEVVIWKRALTADEIRTNWNTKRSGNEDGVTGYWNFEMGSPRDVSPNQHGGTLLGGATIVPAENPGLGGKLQEVRMSGTGAYSFTNLTDGALYRIQAFLDSNRNGIWDTNELKAEKDAVVGSGGPVDLHLSARTPFAQSLWLLVSAGVFALAGSAGLIRFLERKKMNARLERLQREHQVEVERSRIARDIHDELGGKLARISYMSEICKREATNPEMLEALARASRDVLRTLDSIVWAISPKYDSLENLVGYIGEYAREFFQMTLIDCQIDIPPELPQLELTAPVRHNLFRVVQENLNNILKHAGASRVTVSFEATESQLVISITDNGRGFSPSSANPGFDRTQATSRKGNGLEIMRQRLQSIGGDLQIHSAERKGTRVTIAWAPASTGSVRAGQFAKI